jgi:hypothetical protein
MPVTDTVAIPTVTYPVAGGILEPVRIWQPPQQGDITNTFSHHRYWQSKITFIEKLARITSSFKLLSSRLVWMES